MGILNKKQLSSISGIALASILVITVFTAIPPMENSDVLVVLPGDAGAIPSAGFELVPYVQSFLICNTILLSDGSERQVGTVNYNVVISATDTDGNAGTLTVNVIMKDEQGNDVKMLLVRDFALLGAFAATIFSGTFDPTGGGFGGGATFTVSDTLTNPNTGVPIAGSEKVILEIKINGGNKVLIVLNNPQCSNLSNTS